MGDDGFAGDTINRSAFLRGRFANREEPMLPPWSLREERFVDACTRCDDCVAACLDSLIVKGRAGFPEMDFTRGGCTFCARCVDACQTGALTSEGGASPWVLTADVTGACLSLAGVTCRVCGDHCDENAIAFRLAVGGVATPIVDASACTGCGACVAPCPVNAIDMTHRQERTAA